MAGVLAGQIRWRTMSLSKSLPTAHKSRPSTPSEAGSLLSSKRSQSSGDHFDLNREMGRIRERLGNASLAERKMAATPVKKKLERVPTPGGTTLAYTPTKSPEYKKIKVEPIAQAAKAPGHNASPPVSTRSASAAAGDGTGVVPKAGGFRSSLTMSTLVLGGSQHGVQEDLRDVFDCQGSISEYMANSSSDDASQREADLVKWIKVRGPQVEPEDANGFEGPISTIWHHVHQRDQCREDLLKARATFQHHESQIERVKQIQVKKWGANHPKMGELDKWASEKLEVHSNLVRDKENMLATSENLLSNLANELLDRLRAPDHVDPECQALLSEVEGLFEGLSIEEDMGKNGGEEEEESSLMDITSHALSKVKALPDGPQKAALQAVLEAAMTVPQQVENSILSGFQFRSCSIRALARKDTTQLEAEKRDQTLHEKYRNDPDCIFLPCGGVKFIGPKGREENEREHLERLQHNADMRFQRSFKSPSCPQAIVELWSKRKSNPSVVPLLFEDFVQSGENWLQASLVVSSTRTSTQKRKGRYVLLPYRDVKQRFGPAIAGSILATKKELEKNKSPSDATVYWMEHPDAPGVEDWSLVRVWDAMEFEDEHADSSSVGVEGRGDFDLGQSKDILSKALGPHMDKFKSLTFGGGSHEGEGSLPPDGNVPGKKEPKVQPMSKRLSKYISQCSTKMTDVLAWKSKLDENKTGLTDVLVNGFRHELDARLSDMKSSRIELERLYALRVDDEKLDDPIHLQYKEDSMKALRGADAAFNSYAGSIRSIKNVLDPKPKAKAKAKAKAKSDPPGPGDVEEPAAPNA
eukprot:s3511_g3.t2